MLLHLREECLQRSPRGIQIARFAQQMAESLKTKRRDTIARWRRVIGSWLGPSDELLVVAAGEEEPSRGGVLESREQRIGERLREFYVLDPEPRLNEVQQCSDQIRMIVEIGVQVRPAIFIRGKQPPVDEQRR